MNTASRLESTGIPGRVQISEQTAELLRQAGKSQWLIKREEKVAAKGKEHLQIDHQLLTQQHSTHRTWVFGHILVVCFIQKVYHWSFSGIFNFLRRIPFHG